MTDVGVRRDVEAPPVLMHWSLPAAVAAAVAGACAVVATHNPDTHQITPPCVLFSHLGIYCPGCGGTRAAYDLMHGDVLGALHMNAFATLVLIPGAVIAIVWWLALTLKVPMPKLALPGWLPWAVLIFFGAFSVLRNLPGIGGYLAP